MPGTVFMGKMISGIDQHTDFLGGALVLIDKPLEWSSFDVVKKVRKTICK